MGANIKKCLIFLGDYSIKHNFRKNTILPKKIKIGGISMKKLLSVVLAAATVFAFAGCSKKEGGFDSSTSYTSSNTEFIIGSTGPLTGDASSYGISVQQGAQLAVDEINEAGGINGVKIKFDMKDDKAATADAATGYDALYEAGMNASIGSVTSGSCDSFGAKAAEDNLFFITPSASAANVIEGRKNGFRVCFGDPDQGTLAAEELTKNFTKIGAIYDTSDPYSSGIFEAFDEEMKKLGVEYTVRTFDAENKKDFSTQVEAMADCEVIFLPIYYTEAGLIARAAVAKGIGAELFGCDGLDGVASQIDSSVKNQIKYITPFDVNSKEEKVSTFVNSYKAKYNALPDQFAADAYDAVYAVFNAMKKTGVNNVKVDPTALGTAMAKAITASDFSYDGVTGKMTWEASGACNKVPVIVELG